MALSSAAFDLPSLYVPGLALIALASAAAGWAILAVRGLRLERGPVPASLIEDEPCELAIDLRTGRVPLPGGTVAVRAGGERVIPTGTRGVRHITAVARFDRRGPTRLEPARVRVSDPLALASRTLETAAADVLVLPRVEPVSLDERGSKLGTRAGSLAGAAAELELDSLRPYQSGTSAARIHWPTFARTGEMMERRLMADVDSRPLVVLDASRPASRDALDRAVRAAGSLCFGLAKGGGCAILLPGDRRPTDVGADLRGWPPLHMRLALIESTAESPRLPAVTGRVAVFWITARSDGAPAGFVTAAAAERYVVAAEPQAGAADVRLICGCAVRRLTPASRRAA